MSLHSSHIK